MIKNMKNEELNQEFSARLAEALDDYGLEESARAPTLAGWTGINKKNPEGVRKWLKGMSVPRKPKLLILSNKLGVRAEWLEYGVLPKHINDPLLPPGMKALQQQFPDLTAQEGAAVAAFVHGLRSK